MASVANPAYTTWSVQLNESTLKNFCAVAAEVPWDSPKDMSSALSMHSTRSDGYWKGHFLRAVRDKVWDTLYSGKMPEDVGKGLMRRYMSAESLVNRHLGLPNLN